jgi:hypothetical protein
MLPPELFPLILHYVDRNDITLEIYERYGTKTFPEDPEQRASFVLELHEARPFQILKVCSLVCRYWANECRKYLFKDATLHINSLNTAVRFRHYTTQGSVNLVRICDLIKAIHVVQQYSSRRSFLDLVHLPPTRNKLISVELKGPAPHTFPPQSLNTPHWGRPGKSVIPYVNNSYQEVKMVNLYLPSFSHATTLIQHFRNAEKYDFDSLRWNGKVAEAGPHSITPTGRSRPAITIRASKCTDNFTVCMQAAMMCPSFPLHTVPEQDYSCAIRMMSYTHDCYNNLSPKKTDTSYIHYYLRNCKQRCGFWPTYFFSD